MRQVCKPLLTVSSMLCPNFMKMKRTILTLFALCFCIGAWAQGQKAKVFGTVTDKNSGESLIGASVVVKGTAIGAATDVDGKYTLSLDAGTYTLVCSYTGYTSLEQTITLKSGENKALNFDVEESMILLGDEVVISASRKPEKLTESPATIAVIDASVIEELPSFNVGELIARQKGVDYVRSGVLGVGVNVRGFNSAFNPKNLQMNDGRLSTLIGTGLPLGSLGTVVKEDIERIEVVLGPSSALYGPNAHNGLVNTITKDPRTSEGTTLALGAGNQSVLSTRMRHAQVLSDKFAFKVSAEYTQGEEFDYTDSVYYNGEAFPELELDRDFNSLRGEAAVYYSINDKSDLVLAYGGSNSNNIGVTNAGRNQIKDWQVHYFHLRYTSPRLFAQVYHTISKTEDTYAMNRRTQNYRSFIDAGYSEAEARDRSFAEQWVWFGGDPTNGVALDRGAVFQDDSRRWNAEVQYNNSIGSNFEFVVGTQVQRDLANSNQTYLLDQNGDIQIDQIGVYGQAEYKFGSSGFKAVLAARGDNHDLYGFNFIPKAALLKIGDKGTWRLTYGQGISAPTILNLEANIFGGLLLGNGEGFTLNDGSTVEALQVETLQTVEFGYKGRLTEKLFLDASAYFNNSKDFLSPALSISGGIGDGITVTHRGDTPIGDIVPGTPEAGADFVLTYLNFGQVNTYGADFGLTYLINSKLSANLNYSYFDFSLDKDDLSNDGNKDGVVTDIDLPINTPKHKGSLALNYNDGKFFGSFFTRWVDSYNFFSGINVASEDNEELGIRENSRTGSSFNYGPLGGFVNFDISAGYYISDYFTVSAQVSNVFDAEVREFVGSPVIGRLYSFELKINIPPIGKKKS